MNLLSFLLGVLIGAYLRDIWPDVVGSPRLGEPVRCDTGEGAWIDDALEKAKRNVK